MTIRDFPPVDELLPHRGNMRLLDQVLVSDDMRVVAAFTPKAGSWYADADGNMPAWIGIELMAQAVAAQVALKKRRAGQSLKIGALLGSKRYQSQVPSFATGEEFGVVAREVMSDESGLGAYDCEIVQAGAVLAVATLKVYEPEDFKQFLQGPGE